MRVMPGRWNANTPSTAVVGVFAPEAKYAGAGCVGVDAPDSAFSLLHCPLEVLERVRVGVEEEVMVSFSMSKSFSSEGSAASAWSLRAPPVR